MSELLTKRLISATEYHEMAEVGILKSEDRVELINGEIIQINPIGSKHTGYLSIIDELLRGILGKKVQVNNQSAIRLHKYSEPEPDLLILKRKKDFYINQLPSPKDAYLIVEVADSTLEKDRQIKAPLYAKANIPEYWILNIPNKQLECYAHPKNGKYQTHQIIKGKQLAHFHAFDVFIKAEDIFVISDFK